MKKTFQYSLLFFVLSAELGMSVTYTWNGSVAPTTGPSSVGSSMALNTNWSAGTAPPLAGPDDLVFPDGAANTAVIDDITGQLSVTSIAFNSSAMYTLTATSPNGFSISGAGTIQSTTGAHSMNIPLSLTVPLLVTSNSGVLSLLGQISGTNTVTIAGGSVLFGASNTYGGITTINNTASLQVSLAASLPTAVVNNGSLNFAVTTGNTETFGRVISRSSSVVGGGLLVSGPGTLVLNQNNSGYSGPVFITAGVLSIAANNNLGDSSSTNALSIGPGILRVTGGATLPASRTISLTGAGGIDTAGSTVTVSGIISEATAGNGSLTVTAGAGSLQLTGANTYSGGTVLQTGTLIISSQGNLGTGLVTIGGTTPTLSIISPISNFSLPISVTSPSTLNLNSNPVTIVKPISGSGALTIAAGTNTLTLSSVGGANTYTGGTTISSGSVVGDSSSIVGNYTFASNTNTLTFNQSISGTLIPSGTYSGILTSSVAQAGTLAKINAGTVIISGDSGASFTGATNIQGGVLSVTGSLKGSSLLTVSPGATLSGSGTVGPVTLDSGAFIGPNGINTLNITGNLNFSPGSTDSIVIAPDGISDLLKVSGVATLNNANLIVTPNSGFYGFGSTYTILQAAPIAGNFTLPADSNFSYTTSKSADGTQLFLNLVVAQPFLGFPATSSNTQSVVNYINALGSSGQLQNNTVLTSAINSLAGQTNAAINDALDQLHPAAYSVFGEVQADVGGHLISMFHRRPGNTSCQSSWRLWAEPYGNWLEEKDTGMQQGFNSRSFGGATGIDWEIFRNFVLGFGGAYNHTDLTWKNNRGNGQSNGYFGAAYADYTYNFLYFGGALLAGYDHYDTNRHIQFTTIDQTANAKHDAFDLIAQFSTGLFFGPSACCFFPYLNVDYFFLDQGSFTETGAPGLNLSVNSFNTQTIRTELGMGLQVKDANRAQTMCLSPRVAIGWTVEAPIYREKITSSIEDETLTFDVKGWDYTWQLLSFTLGLDFSYKCFTLGGEYIGEINGNDKFWSQQANANLSWHW